MKRLEHEPFVFPANPTSTGARYRGYITSVDFHT